jgi:ABC-2 type transport system permease protein
VDRDATSVGTSAGSAATSGEPAVRTVALTRRFGSLTAVDGLSIEIAPGEVFGLIGSNGAAQSVLFVAIFYGISAIWERDLGILQKYLVSPASRTALVLGKALSAGVRGLAGAVIVYLLTLVMDIRTNAHPLAILGVLALIVLGSAVFSTLSLIMACLVKTRERFMGIGQVLTMPIFFASNAIYPLSLMPDWLRIVSRVNPLTYQVDALRALMLPGGTSAFGLGVDVSVLVGTLVALVWTAARLYPRMVT